MSRKILIGASIAGHVVLFAGVFAHSVWDLEQLDHEMRTRTALGVMTPPTASSGELRGKKVELKPKPQVVKEPRQPRKQNPPPTPEVGTDPTGTSTGTGTPDGPIGDDEPPGDPCQEPGACEPPPEPPALPPAPPIPPVPPPPKVHTVAPQILKGLRVRGDTAIHPPREVFQEMYRSRDTKTTATIQVCLAVDGSVASVGVMKSSRYAPYDEAIVAAARRWVYRPYTVNGTPVPACGAVTFVYEMR